MKGERTEVIIRHDQGLASLVAAFAVIAWIVVLLP